MSERADQVTYLQRLIDRVTGRSAAARDMPVGPPHRPPTPTSTNYPPRRPAPSITPPPPPSPRTTGKSGGVTWGSGGSVLDDPLHFVGQIDPLEGTVLVAGEQVSVCTRCGSAYHLTTMSYLRSAAAGACVSCGTAGHFQVIVLIAAPAGGPTPVVEVKPTVTTPVAPPVVPQTPPPPAYDAAGRPIVQLSSIRDHIGEEIAFEGRVLRVHLTGGGAYFLYFEQAARVLDGFRAVIRPRDLFHWEVEGIVPADEYPDQWVRIVGRVVDDPRWQLEMLIQRPESIRVIDAPTQPAGWRTAAGIAPDVPSTASPPAPAKADPPQRIRWLS
ncbi:MAG TPA: hypothetical protein VGT61_13895 [Thermomicrobiales bacterium]|nr:hypothetical protein [Thermomicrobiales bacterium]